MSSKAFTSIYGQLTCLVLACVLPIWLVSGVLVLRGYATKRDQANNAMLDSARTLTMVVDRELTSVQSSLFALATSPAFAQGNMAAVHRQAQQLIQSFPEADIIVADSTGQQLVNSYRPFGTPLPKRKTTETVRRVFSEGKPVISDLFFGAVTHRPLISIDVPVLLNGRVAYDLAMTFPSDRLTAILSRHSPQSGRYSAILDARNTLVARSSHSYLVGSVAGAKLRSALLAAPEGVIELERNLEGTQVFIAYSRSTISNWHVVVGVPKATVLSGVYHWLGLAIAGVGALSLFGMALALSFASKIAKAIRSLVPPALALGSGDLIITEETRSIRETGEVAQALVKASDLLKTRYSDLQDSERRLSALFAKKKSGLIHLKVVPGEGHQSRDLVILRINETCARVLGMSEEQSEGRLLSEAIAGSEEASFDMVGELVKVAQQGGEELFDVYFDPTRSHLAIYAYSPLPGELTAIITDVTRKKRVETYKEMTREILQILGAQTDLHDEISHVLTCLKSKGEYDAVGIRLRDHDDYPYFEQCGFSSSFLASENSLVECDADGKSCRDPHGQVSLCCACGLVLSGRPDTLNPLCTPGGSFWTNELDSAERAYPLCRPRPACLEEGFRSLALIPVRANETILGLLQVSSRFANFLAPEVVEILEGIAMRIGAALVRRKAEEEKNQLEEQLQHAQKLESVGRLAGGVAHDFNNMLSVILGHVNLATMDLEPHQPLFATMNEIRKAAERSAELTGQLLAFARKQPITPTVLKLDQAVAAMLSMLKRIIGEGIALKWHPGEDIWPVKLDRSQFDQILVNLCVNARDAIGGIGTITIQAVNTVIGHEFDALYQGVVPGEYVLLTVSDTGCGMDKDTMALIFEPFFTTKKTGKGTGLGLATVFGAVKQNSGFIHVYSETGIGSTFSVFFPRCISAAVQGRLEVAEPPVQRGSETILLVEDEPAILNVATKLLSRQGYSVLATGSPQAAIELANKFAGRIALLLTDVIMPEMTGRDLVRELHARYPHLKSLFMSGFPADIIAKQGVVDDGIHFLQKPFSAHSLSAKVREALDAA